MKSLSLARILALTAATLLSTTASASAEHYLVYLVGGQSNANGRGDASQLTGALAAPQKDVRFYWHRTQPTKNVGHLTENQWIDLAPGSGHGQTDPVYPKEFGPEVSFGRALADAHTNAKIALIKYSVGGSNLYKQWAADGALYKNFTNTVHAALAALTKAGDTYELRGMIWQQGENDAASPKFAAAYQMNLTHLIERVRKDLFARKVLPFSVGGLSDSQNATVKTPGTGWHAVRQAQESVAKTISNVGFANSDGFSTRTGEAIHFNHVGQVALGKAHAAEILRLEAKAAESK